MLSVPIKRSKIHETVKIYQPVNIYDSKIGEYTKVAAFVEIGGAVIGKNCKIEAFAFIPPGVIIHDNVFVGPHATFTNDKYPSAKGLGWEVLQTEVLEGASIGASSVILPGLTIGVDAVIAAGSVVTKNVPQKTLWIAGKIQTI